MSTANDAGIVAAVPALNHQQQQAVEHAAGPLRIMAGAGTGKTKTLTARIVSLIERELARPEEILALTFTNKAAAEMTARARTELQKRFPHGTQVTVMTYNALGYQIVREHASLIGLPADPLLLSEAERAMFLTSIIDELPVDCFDLGRLAGPNGLIRQLLAFFDRWRDENVTDRNHDELIRLFLDHLATRDKDDEPVAKVQRERLRRRQGEALIAAAAMYEEKLRAAGAIDFGAQISLAVRVFREHPEALLAYRQRYRWLLVDEYQDTNYLQAVLVRQLAGLEPTDDGSAHNITIVGDPDQSIYAFRGAARDSIVDFPRQFAGATCVDLTLNYRSTQPILDAANHLLETGCGHVERDPLKMPAESPVAHMEQTRPQLVILKTAADENAFIARTVETLRQTSRWVSDRDAPGGLRLAEYRYRDIAILLRKNSLADGLYEALTRAGIPVYIDRGARLFDCDETRGLLAYLRALVQPEADADLARAMLMPKFGLTEAAIMAMAGTRGYGESLFAAVRRAAESAPQGAAAGFVSEFLAHHALQFRVDAPALIGDIASAHAGSLTLAGSGNFARLQEIAAEWLARAPRLPWTTGLEGEGGASGAGQLVAFCDYLDILDDNDESPEQVNLPEGEDAVQIITAHAAKGLEWPVVFIARCNQRDWGVGGRGRDKGYFPPSWGHRGVITADQTVAEELAEERRLFYVSLTRAQERLYLTWAPEDDVHKRAVGLYDLAENIRDFCDPVEAQAGEDDSDKAAALTADFCRLHLVRPGPFDLTALRSEWDAFWEEHGTLPPAGTADWFTTWDPAQATSETMCWQAAASGQAVQPDLPTMYSDTHLETYEECPARFNLTYIMQAPARPTRTSAFGSAVHRAVATATARLQAGDQVSGDIVRALIAREIAAEAAAGADGSIGLGAGQVPGPSTTPSVAASSTADSLDAVIDTFLGVSPDGTPVGVELEFYAAIGGAVIHGFIDRLDRLADGTYRIIDYKTHARPWSEAEARERLQIPLYILGCRAIGYDTHQGELVFLRHGKRIVIEPDEAELADVARRVADIVAAINRRDFPGRPGNQCRYCPHADFCADAAVGQS